MQLAEALIRRKEHKTRLSDLRRRLENAIVVQEGDQPFEDPEELLALLEATLESYEILIASIHRTNLSARLPDGRSLTEGIVARDILDERMAMLRHLADQAGRVNERVAHSELRYVPTVDVAALRRTVDTNAQERRQLDVMIQATNWRVALEGPEMDLG